jgi:prophage regulatory protein
MRDILLRLRSDAGQLTIAALIQEREAAACEIESLRRKREQIVPNATVVRATKESKSATTVPTQPSAEVRAFHPNTLLRLKDVCALLQISRSTIYNQMSQGSFPSPVRLGERSVRWRAEDVDAWRRGLTRSAPG